MLFSLNYVKIDVVNGLGPRTVTVKSHQEHASRLCAFRMMRCAWCMFWVVFVVGALVFGGFPHGLPDAFAQSGGKKTAKPRSEVNAVPGEYIQLNVIWIPVSDGKTTIYKGIFVRLYVPPSPDLEESEPQEGEPQENEKQKAQKQKNEKKKDIPEDARFRACVLTSWAREAIITHFSDIPASLGEFGDPEKLNRRVEQAVQTISEKEVYEKVEASTEILVADEQSEMLSNTCR